MQRVWVNSLFTVAQQREWFGTITIKMERGKVVRLVKEESLLPPNVTDTPPRT